ncbi:MAG: dipeptidase [Treponema sp.]|jgi:membrane dipeptidase|nr:dipeptidase [Treponema sp.]
MRVIDLHCDSVYSLARGKDLRLRNQDCHVDLPRLKEGGVGCQVFAAFVPSSTKADGAFAFAGEKLDLIDAFARSAPEPEKGLPALTPVETAADIRAAMAAGKTGILAAVENGLAIEDSLDKLERLRRRGVRILTLVHDEHHSWAASCTGSGRPPAGLSSFGRLVIDAMNDLGILVDLSHASESAFWDALERSKKPVIASHSCCKSLCGASRNLSNDQLKALGEKGGLAGVNFYSAFLSETFRLAMERDPSTGEGSKAPEAPFSLIADHIDHMVRIAGEDAVALGSDFDGIPSAPQGVTGCDMYPRLEAELLSRGYTARRIEKIFSGNFLRVLEAWEA